MNFVPNLGKVLLELNEEEKSKGGIVLVGGSLPQKRATVVKVGPIRWVDSNVTYMEFFEGDEVLVDSISLDHSKVTIEGKQYYLVRGEDILGLLKTQHG